MGHRFHTLHILPSAVALAIVAGACGGDDKKEYIGNIDPATTPTITTVNVNTLISDSGITRYRVSAPVWYIFDETKEPCWTFPQSLHLERYDEFFNKEATVDCDSATYFRTRQLWRLDGHVTVVNMAGEKFLTPQLFWDERKHLVYSDSFIQVIRADRIMEGHGFESDESMSRFNVRNVSAILPVEQFRPGENADSVAPTIQKADSAAAPPTDSIRRPRPRRPTSKPTVEQ